MYQSIDECRICQNRSLETVLDLGEQRLTGMFPRTLEQPVPQAPMELVKCHGPAGGQHCGLVQTRFTYDLGLLYGGEYGYRSGLNRSMVLHLEGIVRDLSNRVRPSTGDLLLDIGSNDGTLLSFYPDSGAELVGMDPTADRFAAYYKPHIRRVADFFSAENFRAAFPARKAKIVTSIAMFYDLDRPLDFMRQVASILDNEGVWHFEQSYLPAMLAAGSYDTACHEHLEYYGLRQIKFMTDRAGLKILDVKFNDINGGSFAVTVAKAGASQTADTALVQRLLRQEDELGLDTLAPYAAFQEATRAHRVKLRNLLETLKSEGRLVIGYGASTKGNVILQYCGITPQLMPYIAEVNAEKFGCFTPGTGIPIIPETEALALRPDYMLVLPWHFRRGICERESAYLRAGGKLIFPMPQLEVVG
ncbi:MAG: class I SAM-dependent methyltransferase [Thermoguttaceae bacterium]